jgi:hypothetical protein
MQSLETITHENGSKTEAIKAAMLARKDRAAAAADSYALKEVRRAPKPYGRSIADRAVEIGQVYAAAYEHFEAGFLAGIIEGDIK